MNFRAHISILQSLWNHSFATSTAIFKKCAGGYNRIFTAMSSCFPVIADRAVCCDILHSTFPQLVEDVPLQTRAHMWFMHNGAPLHFNIADRTVLNDKYPERWVGRGEQIAWPPRSPDLHPADFYLWGHLKSIAMLLQLKCNSGTRVNS
jgi:hypothetical protein